MLWNCCAKPLSEVRSVPSEKNIPFGVQNTVRTVLVAQIDAYRLLGGRLSGRFLGCGWALLLGLRRVAGGILLQGRSPLLALRVRRFG
jgi:hypothetical protein